MADVSLADDDVELPARIILRTDLQRDATGRNAVQHERSVACRGDADARAPVSAEALRIGLPKADTSSRDSGTGGLVVEATAKLWPGRSGMTISGVRLAAGQCQAATSKR